MGEVVDDVAKRVFTQPCVFGCSIGSKLERCAIPVLDPTLVALVEALVSLIVSSSSSITRELSEVCQRECRLFTRNALLVLILAITNLIESKWTFLLALLAKSLKEILEHRPRRRLDHRERSTTFDRVILVVIVDIICLVDFDRVFLEALDAPTTM